MESDDLALLDRWRDGDNEAGQALFQRHFTSVFGFFETKCRPEAEELTQATFLACVRAKDQFRKASSFRTYLFAIARNELHHLLRTRQRKDDKLDFEVSSLADLASSVGTKMVRDEEHRRVVAALQQLPVDQQMLLELHYWEDQDISSLAEVFDVPPTTIRTRLHRARKALRDVVGKIAPPGVLDTDETMDRWIKNSPRT